MAIESPEAERDHEPDQRPTTTNPNPTATSNPTSTTNPTATSKPTATSNPTNDHEPDRDLEPDLDHEPTATSTPKLETQGPIWRVGTWHWKGHGQRAPRGHGEMALDKTAGALHKSAPRFSPVPNRLPRGSRGEREKSLPCPK